VKQEVWTPSSSADRFHDRIEVKRNPLIPAPVFNVCPGVLVHTIF